MINALVRYTRIDTSDDKETGYYPPIGTFGIVEDAAGDSLEIRWDGGTKGDQLWWCHINDVEIVYNPRTDGRIVAIRLLYAEKYTSMVEMLFSNERSTLIEWNARTLSCIDAHTLIYDERINKPFKEYKEEQKIWRT